MKEEKKAEKIEKSLLSLAGEYAVASELCKRNYYCQLTLGNQKKADLLVYSPNSEAFVVIESKAKQVRDWTTRGICGNKVLIFVDFKGKSLEERPDFYILDSDDWKKFIRTWSWLRDKIKKGEVEINKYEEPVWKGQINKNSKKEYCGVSIRPEYIFQFKEKWSTIKKHLK